MNGRKGRHDLARVYLTAVLSKGDHGGQASKTGRISVHKFISVLQKKLRFQIFEHEAKAIFRKCGGGGGGVCVCSCVCACVRVRACVSVWGVALEADPTAPQVRPRRAGPASVRAVLPPVRASSYNYDPL